MEEQRQKQLKLGRKFQRELSARRFNPEVGEDNIQDEKSYINDGAKDGEEGNDVIDHHDGEDSDGDYTEDTSNLSAKDFKKKTKLSCSVSKEQDPKKHMALVSKRTQTEV